ncbi:MAG TPA: hypothetical protein VGI95_01645 [Caulobacteraceae bacterium]|jgi:hypothetical protein
MIRTLWIGLATAVSLVFAAGAQAKTSLFTDDAPLKMVITAPFPALAHAAPTSKNPYPASLIVTDGANAPETLPITLHARGLTRRTDFCSFPPLSLGFDKETRHGTIFQGQHKLKLVTYCKLGADYEQRVVLEYLAYKMYNLITPMSFRARAAEVTYRTSPTDAGVTRFGFLIEDISDVAARNDRGELKAAAHQLTPARLDAHAAGEATLFEFLIGNLDWELLASTPGTDCCHNGRLIAAPKANAASATDVVPVPYDYDFSGLVDSPYAGPPEGIPVSRVTDRYYRGYCVSKSLMPGVIDEYRTHRADMAALIANEPHLTGSYRSKAGRFVDSFFALLDDPQRVQREIVNHCR